MMVVTTMFLAIAVLALLYFVAIRRIRSAAVSYLMIAVLGIGFTLLGTVHFIYVGIELLVFGTLLIWLHFRRRAKSSLPPLPPSEA